MQNTDKQLNFDIMLLNVVMVLFMAYPVQKMSKALQTKDCNLSIVCVLITGWAVALTCCISHIVKYRKKADFDPSGSQNRLTNFDETWHG